MPERSVDAVRVFLCFIFLGFAVMTLKNGLYQPALFLIAISLVRSLKAALRGSIPFIGLFIRGLSTHALCHILRYLNCVHKVCKICSYRDILLDGFNQFF